MLWGAPPAEVPPFALPPELVAAPPATELAPPREPPVPCEDAPALPPLATFADPP
jgi:hypothetical protein